MPPGGKKHTVSSAEMVREGPVEDLPLRALSRPRDTARVAQRVLAANRSPYVRSYAGQALGITLAYAGRSKEGLRHLDVALSQASGVPAARIRLRRGNLLGILGRTSEA